MNVLILDRQRNNVSSRVLKLNSITAIGHLQVSVSVRVLV